MNAIPQTLPTECRKATKILLDFVDPVHGLDRVIPVSVLRRAKGFAIFSVVRIGLLMSARAGSGLVIAKLPDGSWSPPTALGIGGLGGGFNAGAEVTDFLIILNSSSAVRSFMSTGSLQLGGNLSVAVGPVGRSAEAAGAVNTSGKLAAMFSYSKSKGVYAGISVEGTVLVERTDANVKAYGRGCTAKRILSGAVDTPDWAQSFLSTVERFTQTGAYVSEASRRSADVGSSLSYSDDDDDETAYGGSGGAAGRRASARDGVTTTSTRSYADDLNDLERDFGRAALGNDRYGASSRPPAAARRRSSGGAGMRFGAPSSTSNPFGDDGDDGGVERMGTMAGEYAFGSKAGGSVSNDGGRRRLGSPKSRRSNASTDYGKEPRDSDDFGWQAGAASGAGMGKRSSSPLQSRLPSFTRHRSSASTASSSSGLERTGVQPRRRSSAAYGESLGGSTGTQHVLLANRSARSGGPGFPMKFGGSGGTGLSDSSSDDEGARGAAAATTPGTRHPGSAFAELDGDALRSSLPPNDMTAPRAWDPSTDARESARLRRREQANERAFSGKWNLTRDEEQRRRTELDELDRELQGEGGGGGGKGGSGGRRFGGDGSARASASSKLRGGSSSSSTSSEGGGNAPSAYPDWREDYFGTATPAADDGATHGGGGGAASPTAKFWNRVRGGGAGGGGNGNSAPWSERNGGGANWRDDTKWGSAGSIRRATAARARADEVRCGGAAADAEIDHDGVEASSSSAARRVVVASFDFAAQQATDLELRRGDVVEVLKSTADRDEWWWGKCRGKVGSFPANYTEDV